jgi:alpha-tubulin suppressor-like RCC1 family protein
MTLANKQRVNGSFESIYTNMDAFAALDQSGSIAVSGEVECGGQDGDQPQEAGYETIASSLCAFAALKEGQISSWGLDSFGGGQIPTHSNVTQLFSNWGAFAALQDNGKIITWGTDVYGGADGPEDGGYIAIASGNTSFSAIKADGTVAHWGTAQDASLAHFLKAPKKIDGNVAIYANKNAFAALSSQGEISIWGPTTHGGSWRILTGVGRLVQRSEISDKGFQSIAVTSSAFAALKDDGSILSWGNCADTYIETIDCDGLEPGQSQGVYTKIYSNSKAFAALDSNGYIATWGSPKCGGSPAGSDTNIKSPPTGDGYTSIYAGECHFTAVNKDGSDFHWGKLE